MKHFFFLSQSKARKERFFQSNRSKARGKIISQRVKPKLCDQAFFFLHQFIKKASFFAFLAVLLVFPFNDCIISVDFHCYIHVEEVHFIHRELALAN